MVNKSHCRLTGLFLALLCFVSLSNAQKSKAPADNETDCLVVTGGFDETMKALQGKYKVKILRDNKVVDEQELKVRSGFKFTLKRDVRYTLRIEKEGYIPRMMCIDTKIPEKADLEELFKFHFETNLIDEAFYNRFEDDDIDFPIALVAYAKKCDCFEYDKKYTQELMARLVNTLMLGGY